MSTSDDEKTSLLRPQGVIIQKSLPPLPRVLIPSASTRWEMLHPPHRWL